MLDSLPPLAWTARAGRRLRTALLALACAGSLAASASARGNGIRVLIAATVDPDAQSAMSPALWQRLVSKYVNAESIPFAGASPALADCHAAHADYLVVASFALVPHPPGTPTEGGRTAALAAIAITNCITGNLVSQRTIALASDPPDESDAGDFETTPGLLWTKSAPATLAKNPPPFVHVARIVTVSPPFALVNLSDSGLKQGDELVDVAGSDRVPRAAIPLTVTDVLPQYVQVLFPHAPGDPQPHVGDLIEPPAARP